MWHQKAGWQYEFMRTLNAPPQWMLDQIHEDLAILSPAEMKSAVLTQFMKDYEHKSKGWLLVRVMIHNHHILLHKMCIHKEDCRRETKNVRLEWILKALAHIGECVPLPNADFIISLHDSFDIDLPVPIMGFAKNPRLAPRTILIPDFEALNGNQHWLEAVHSGNERYPWSQKKEQAIFRGSLTGGDYGQHFLDAPRSKAVTLSLKFPEIIDAKFNFFDGWEWFKERFEDYFGPSMSVEDHLAYKYQLLIDGNSCAYSRAYWQLFTNCVIMKQVSENIQWYYRGLQPWVHYIPVDNDMGNLPERIAWAIDHDDEAQKISGRAQDFAKNNLIYAKVMQYLYWVVKEYSKIQNG